MQTDQIEKEIESRNLKFIFAARIPEDSRNSAARWLVLARQLNGGSKHLFIRYSNGTYGLPKYLRNERDCKEFVKSIFEGTPIERRQVAKNRR